MGVVTTITLNELNYLFPSYSFTKMIPTTSGIIDTTYIVFTNTKGYILKKYERDISTKIEDDKKLLKNLKTKGLNTPTCLDENGEWFLYKKLDGSTPKTIKSYHIVALGRFLAKFHNSKVVHNSNFIDSYDVSSLLNYTKKNYFYHYKKLQFLESFEMKNDGFIHGDIFKDNTVFDGNKIGVFDFIDSGNGSFSFDCGVGMVGFEKVSEFYINLFLNSYNQHTIKKLTKEELKQHIKLASRFYALLRINKYKNTKKAKELMIF